MIKGKKSINSELPLDFVEGRDELNIAEFPIAAVSRRIRPETKTLFFEDSIWDGNLGEKIHRKLSISGSDLLGLPNAYDDEVILGLIQMTKRYNNFESPTVYFSRYDLIKVLGWPNNGQSFRRIEESLDRWVGVTLYLKKAWRDKDAQKWISDTFHILEHVRLVDRIDLKQSRAQCAENAQMEFCLSSFTWNRVIFNNLRSGNLKLLDLELYRGLENAAAKRLFRFLDKRFWNESTLRFNLRDLACNKIGFSRSYDIGQLKRNLAPSIQELEENGFLKKMPRKDRFVKVSKGVWEVVFIKNCQTSAPGETLTEIQERLSSRGVTPDAAKHLAASFPEREILRHLDVFDWLVARGDKRIAGNAAGFLVKSITDDYAPPREYEALSTESKNLGGRIAVKSKPSENTSSRNPSIDEFWESLPPVAKREIREEAFHRADRFQRQYLDRGGPVGDAVRQNLLDSYIESLISK